MSGSSVDRNASGELDKSFGKSGVNILLQSDMNVFSVGHIDKSFKRSELERVRSEADVSNEIFFLERDIADLNAQYKQLLAKCSSGTGQPGDSTAMGAAAARLEEKSEKLLELKRVQQEMIKAYIA